MKISRILAWILKEEGRRRGDEERGRMRVENERFVVELRREGEAIENIEEEEEQCAFILGM